MARDPEDEPRILPAQTDGQTRPEPLNGLPDLDHGSAGPDPEYLFQVGKTSPDQQFGKPGDGGVSPFKITCSLL